MASAQHKVKSMDDNCGEWVECMGVVSRKWVWLAGCGWNLWVWLVGVVVRRYIDFLLYLLFCSSIPTFFGSFFNVFLSFRRMPNLDFLLHGVRT